MTETKELQPVGEAALFRLLRRVSVDDWITIAAVLATKALLLIFGVRAYRVLEDHNPPGPHTWLELWNRWDALVYQRLARVGYDASDILKDWFYPLYPWCVRVVGRLCDDYLVGAFLVSGVASIAAALLLFRIAQLDHSSAVARRSVWFFLIFPTAYFLHIGYTESLFLALALCSILAARRDCWWLAGFGGALAWMTQPSGIILLPTLAVEAGYQYFLGRRWQWRWLWLALVPLGFGVYLLLNWHVAGDPLAFLRVRKEVGYNSFAPPWTGLLGAYNNIRRNPNQSEMVGVQELVFSILGLVATVASWFKLRPTYAVWMTGSWLLYTSAKFVASAPRYSLTMFPLFILFAILARYRLWNLILTMWSLLFMALFASLFVRSWWAF